MEIAAAVLFMTMTEPHMTTSQRERLSARSEPFTPSLQSFFQEAANWPWDVSFPNALFIRDYHDLPVSSPHDIDLIMDTKLQKPFAELVRRMAGEHGLHCTTKLSSDVCSIILFDLDTSAKGRAWAFLETRDNIRFTTNLSVSARDISIMKDQTNGLPVPSTPWKAFLEISQGVRTGNISKSEQILRAIGVRPVQSEGLFKSLLGLDAKFGQTLEHSQDTLNKISLEIIHKQKKTERPMALPMKTRLNRFLFSSFYFYHRGRPLFFTIHGPDGVGKTTTCTEVEKIFSRLPLPFSSFHHITGWKRGLKTERLEGPKKAALRGSKEWQPGLLHLLLRWIYRRLLPESVKNTYLLVQGYNMYLRKLNAMIYSSYCKDCITFVDRYIYDMATKNLIQGSRQRWIHKIFIRLSRNPITAFILTDQAEAIRKRKQELTLKEIASFQQIMFQLFSDRGVNVEQVNVGGRTPQAIAREISQKILDDCGFALLVLMRTGKVGTETVRGIKN